MCFLVPFLNPCEPNSCMVRRYYRNRTMSSVTMKMQSMHIELWRTRESEVFRVWCMSLSRTSKAASTNAKIASAVSGVATADASCV